MTSCCILEKRINTTYIPGNPGQAGHPGSPAKPAYCATNYVNVCEWVPNPAISYNYECWYETGWYVNGYGHQVYGLHEKCGIVTYYNGQKLTTFLQQNNLVGLATTIYQCYQKPVTTCYPATAAIPPTPYIAPTPAQIITDYNIGWNSHSRGIDTLDVGEIFTFTLSGSNHGAFVGLAPSGADGQSIALYGWGLMVDTSGVKVYENGVVVDTLAASYNSTTAFSMERTLDGELIYRADLDEYTSTVPPSVGAVLYPYTYLYSGGDRLMCASYASLNQEVFGSATMTGAGTLLVGPPSVDGTFLAKITMSGVGALSVEEPYPYTITLTGEGTLSAGMNTITVQGNLPALDGFGADFDYSFVNGSFPAMTFNGGESLYVPPQPDKVIGVFPQLQFWGYMQSVDLGDVDGDLPALEGFGADYNYAFVDGTFPPMVAFGVEGVRLDMEMMSSVLIYDTTDMWLDLVLVLMSNGQLASVQTMEHIKVESFISGLTGASVYSELGEYNAELMSALKIMSLQTLAIDGQAALDQVGRVWVVNMDSAASSQYDNYGFNSFFVRDGESYGVADDGIYRLSGDTDLLAPITAQINTGSTRFGSSKDKVLPAVYINAASEGKLILRVETENDSAYYYEARSSSTTLDNHRVDTGRGLKSNNWTFTLMNQDGDDFELANLEFVPLQGTRRI